MEVEFASNDLEQLEADNTFDCGFGQDIVRGYRKRMQTIRAALDERDFYALKSLRFEKLKGERQHQYSMRINDQWRLIIEIIENKPKNIVRIIRIEDYH
ncbi:MAG: plasmid maintenance system killer protein [Planctomycetes bacterium RBG_13_46_10]|nr:MAG: plasmid maintenance system killer protein [Planctomycetes bacterium RBG_13_46_10]